MKRWYAECLYTKDSIAAIENTYLESLVYLMESFVNETKIIMRLEKL